MKTGIAIILAGWLAASAASAAIAPCDPALSDALPKPDNSNGYSGFEYPPVRYPHGTLTHFGFFIDMVVDANGRVVCAGLGDSAAGPGAPDIHTPQRDAAIALVSRHRFTPFHIDGKPAKVFIEDYVEEQSLPLQHVPRPQGDAATVHIHQTRTTPPQPGVDHFDLGPAYDLDIYGDGRVVRHTRPDDDDDVIGEQTYHIPPQAVAAMLDELEDDDFWSLDDDYRMRDEGWEGPVTTTTVTIGGVSKSLATDLDSTQRGLPEEVLQFEWGLQRAVNEDMWDTLSGDTLDVLEANHFPFASNRGGHLLINSLADSDVGDAVVKRLIDEGVALDGYDDTWGAPLSTAIAFDRTAAAQQLVARGALLVDGQVDLAKVDDAFCYALSSHHPNLVDMIVAYKPSMTCPVNIVGGGERQSAFFELASAASINSEDDDIITIAQTLLDHGADIHDRGKPDNQKKHDSLMTTACEGDSAVLVKFLLAHGVSPDRADAEDRSPLATSINEDILLMLLDAGASLDKLTDKERATFFRYVNAFHWARIDAWLKAHNIAIPPET